MLSLVAIVAIIYCFDQQNVICTSMILKYIIRSLNSNNRTYCMFPYCDSNEIINSNSTMEKQE